MRPRFLIAFTLLVAALTAPLVSRAGTETPANSYDAIQIGGAGTFSSGLNDAGHVAGGYMVGDNQHAFLWSNGVLTDLGTLGGAESSAAAINNGDQVVGWALTPSGAGHAFLWNPGGSMQDLGTLGGSSSAAHAINDAGQIVGSAEDAAGAECATLWQNGQTYNLGVPPGFAASTAYGINASGQVVGNVRDVDGKPWAFRWTPTVPNGTTGTMVALHPVAGNTAYGINAGGEAVGEAIAANEIDSWSTLWDATGAHTLPPLPGSFGSTAWGINASRTVVGSDYFDDGLGGPYAAAYAWDPTHGARYLDVLVNDLELSLQTPTAVNASGQIVANAWDGWVYVLTPSGVPVRPVNLGAVPEATRVTLTWDPSSGAQQYHVRRAPASGGSFTPLGTVAGPTFTDTTVTSGVSYTYVVSASNSYGESSLS